MPISTHALTEGDRKTESVLCIDNISTHALTEGDYAGLTPTSTSVIISTHALTEGDHPTEPRVAFGTYFNSRPHRGRREAFHLFLFQNISTHALTEGDSPSVTVFPGLSLFQLTPSQRATASYSA